MAVFLCYLNLSALEKERKRFFSISIPDIFVPSFFYILFLWHFLIAKERISIEKGSRCIKKVRNKKKPHQQRIVKKEKKEEEKNSEVLASESLPKLYPLLA